MPRITNDELEYCVKFKKCWDCHAEGTDTTAIGLQPRRTRGVPCCQKHFDDYERKVRQQNHVKYERRSQIKQKLELCVYPGCHNKLIPRELLLAPWRERTCGMHGSFKAFRMNRSALIQLIIDRCLTEEERRDVDPQNIVYKPGDAFVFVGMKHPGSYHTKILSATALYRLYRETHSRMVHN